MPCTSGLTPVVIDVQAGGVSGLRVDINCAAVPFSIMWVRNGSAPCSDKGLNSVKVAPSRPIIRTRLDTSISLVLKKFLPTGG